MWWWRISLESVKRRQTSLAENTTTTRIVFETIESICTASMHNANQFSKPKETQFRWRFLVLFFPKISFNRFHNFLCCFRRPHGQTHIFSRFGFNYFYSICVCPVFFNRSWPTLKLHILHVLVPRVPTYNVIYVSSQHNTFVTKTFEKWFPPD